MSGWRPAYTLQEDLNILRYIINGDYGSIVKGDKLWKQMEEEGVVADRTWYSMKNRWRKTIVIDLGRPEYGLAQEEKTMLKAQMGLSVFSGRPVQTYLKKQEKEHRKGPPNEVKKESEKSQVVAAKEKEFHSLDVEWSDSDTE